MKLQILKNDGNGGYAINLPIALITLAITIVVTLIPAVVAYGALNEKVDNLEKTLDVQLPNYVKYVKDITDRVVELEKIAARTEVSLEIIQKDIDEIKIDLKNLIKEIQQGSK